MMKPSSDGCDNSTPAEGALRYVACVSYPRSGHHLTMRILQHYFRKRFRYCQYYKEDDVDCCRAFPCTNANVTMTKNHDMDLNDPSADGVPKLSEVPYLILVRNFLEAVVSDYNLYLRQHPDSLAAWRKFSRAKSVYYRRFLQKWVLSEDDDLQKLIVRYEALTENPLTEFRRVIEFFRPRDSIDETRLERLVQSAVLEDVRPNRVEVIRGFGIHNRRRIEDFQYYDPVYFGELEHELSDELSRCGYPCRFDTVRR